MDSHDCLRVHPPATRSLGAGLLLLVVLAAGCHQSLPLEGEVVGPEGGAVTLDSGTQVEVPAGALEGPTSIELTEGVSDLPPLPEGAVAISEAVAFEPHGTTFVVPVTIDLALTGDPSGRELRVYRLDDEDDSSWERVQPVTAGAGALGFETSEFSIYQAGALPAGVDGGMPDAGIILDAGTPDAGLPDAGGPLCGDGFVDIGEACDDGNTIDEDGCNADCSAIELCGDGITQPGLGEQCDDGNAAGGDGCEPDCTLLHGGGGCGDGVLEPGYGEECDDGNYIGGDGCSTSCQFEICGNGITDTLAGEACDDGNTDAGDGCNADCSAVEVCGDGITQFGLGEACDDGNIVSGDGCHGDCSFFEECGDGVVQVGEDCDDGNTQNGDGCTYVCTVEFCGDGITQPGIGESCDDGNAMGGDGCSADCLVE